MAVELLAGEARESGRLSLSALIFCGICWYMLAMSGLAVSLFESAHNAAFMYLFFLVSHFAAPVRSPSNLCSPAVQNIPPTSLVLRDEATGCDIYLVRVRVGVETDEDNSGAPAQHRFGSFALPFGGHTRRVTGVPVEAEPKGLFRPLMYGRRVSCFLLLFF